MEIVSGDIVLRDSTIEDTDNYVRWNTVETEWMDWDAPWEKDAPFDADDFRRKKLEFFSEAKDENRLRYRLELDYKGRHIGSVSSYHIDESYNFAKEGRLAIGMDIYEPEYWGKGIGGRAYSAYIEYLFSRGYSVLYTQTWSGNMRMIRMARRLGFEQCHLEKDARLVQGRAYDRVTFKKVI